MTFDPKRREREYIIYNITKKNLINFLAFPSFPAPYINIIAYYYDEHAIKSYANYY
jgi:hypothetical protein